VTTVAATDLWELEATEPFTVERDGTAPQAWITAPERSYTTTIPVSWGASESQSGVGGYDVEVSDDGGESYTRWLTGTSATSDDYEGEWGRQYTFRVTASDEVSNTGSAETQAAVPGEVTRYYYHPSALLRAGSRTRVAMRVSQEGESTVYYLHADHPSAGSGQASVRPA
jgi:hypothetical protein